MKDNFFQHFILGCEGDDINANPNLCYCLKRNLGGVIFFTQNIITEKRFIDFVKKIKISSEDRLFLSIDQEGGRVERTENIHNGKKYKSAQYIALDGVEALKKQTQQIADELRSYELNMNFSPVCDVNSNPDNPIIGERAYSSDTDTVSRMAKIVSDIYLNNGIIPVAKHFPGHGDTHQDSHLTMPVVKGSKEEFERVHVKPFIFNIDIPAIMVSHVHYTMFDNDPTPASLSKNVIEKYLLGELNYKGIVISDDMVMGALNGYDPVESIIKGIDAGISMFIYRNSDDKTLEVIEEAEKECKKSTVLSAKAEQSVERICEIKKLCYYK